MSFFPAIARAKLQAVAIAELDSWLSSREKNYSTGLKLFEKYGDDDFTLQMLSLGETDYNRQEMLRLLVEISKAQPVITTVRRQIANDQEYQKLPDKARQLIDQAKDLIKLNGNRVGELDGIIERALRISDPLDRERFLRENETGDKANMILDTDDEIADLFEQIDYCKIHGQLPEPVPVSFLPEDISYGDLKQIQANLRSQRSKAKGNPDKLEDINAKLTDVDRRLREFV